MSRSLGDLVAVQCGTICKPDTIQMPIEDRHLAIIIASDGVWEFISSQEAVDLVQNELKFGDAK